ncbi:MAG: diphthine--ammonia ligase [Candidatus Aenigmatarchaeota archaeon]
MRLASLMTGGKDSLFAAYKAKQSGHEIKYIVYVVSENSESFMFHVPNIKLVDVHAKLMGVPAIKQKTKGEKEMELLDLKKALKKIAGKVDGITSGAVASNYQKSRIDRVCDELKLKSVSPLWGSDPIILLNEMIDCRFEIIIQAVAAPPLNKSWLGRKIDRQCIKELTELNKKYGIHITGEGGEYESLVLNCPLFSKRIIIDDSIPSWDEKSHSGFLKIKKIVYESN